MRKPKFLHCLSKGGKGLSSDICARMISSLGAGIGHTIVMASGDRKLARHQLQAHFPDDFPRLGGSPTPGRLLKLAQAMAGHDLVLTYDYGALNMAMAHTAFSQAFGLPPLIHHEFGFGEDTQKELSGRRNWYRRIALGRASGLVVPSERLEGIALSIWHQPLGRVRHISPGVRIAEAPKKVPADALRGLIKREGEMWIGSLDGSVNPRVWHNVIGALADMAENWQMVIAGKDAHLGAIRQLAERLEVSHRVHFPGTIEDPARLLGLLDIYLNLDAGDRFPFGALQAMAAGLPIAGISSAELHWAVSEANAPFLADETLEDGSDIRARGDALDGMILLSEDQPARTSLGEQNLARAREEFSETVMIGRLKRLYASALGREL